MSQIELKVFQESYVGKLYRSLMSTNNFDVYKMDKFPHEEKYPSGSTEIFIDENLALDGESDLENSIKLYEALRKLNETQASDERLWVYLTHVTFWDYMRKRWPISENSAGRIKDRYFLRNKNIESLTRNGISRLWWYVHLTIDENRKNKYELTETLLQRADLSVGITERALGSNRNIRTSLLEFLKENPAIASNEDKTREVYKRLNLFGGVCHLPFLEVKEIKAMLEKSKDTL
jgi:hypothetical protein